MSHSHQSELAYKAAFLGPRGENAAELEQLILDVLRDHVFWRRNFHPEDPRLISEAERTDPNVASAFARLRDELFQILARLKNAAPLHSPRQLAHIVSDPSLPGLVGYFAGMLYNQNNVVQEVAPETVRRERDYVAALACMVGYPVMVGEQIEERNGLSTSYSFGHLCSGGTTANMEALWAARNVRLFPLAVRLLAEESSDFKDLGALSIPRKDVGESPLRDLCTADLLDLPVRSILDLHRMIREHLGTSEQTRGKELGKLFDERIKTVKSLGIAGFLNAYNARFVAGERIENLPAVLVPVTSHYGWKKAMDLVGLGSGADTLVEIGVDDRIRMSVSSLEEALAGLRKQRRPVLMVVSVCGTTEEAAVDPIHEVCRLAGNPDVPTFWHHCDAALGGFYATLLSRGAGGEVVEYAQVPEEDQTAIGIEKDVYDALASLHRVDSITLDPHKLGFVPYPCGAVLFRELAMRDFIAFDAPYLAGSYADGFGGFLGKWTLEGSRPGAAAVSCYLSQAVLPLDRRGHGQLVSRCVHSTKTLFEALRERFDAEGSRLCFCPFNEAPDATGFCFALVPRFEEFRVEDLNAYTQQVWKTMTVDGSVSNVGEYAFLISKSGVSYGKYASVVARMLRGTPMAKHLPASASGGSAEGLDLLRVAVLNPLVHEWIEKTTDLPGAERFDDVFSQHVYDKADRLLAPFLLQRFAETSRHGRLQILIVEDEKEDAESITKKISFGADFSRFLAAHTIRSESEVAQLNPEDWDKVVLDINLDRGNPSNHDGVRLARMMMRKGFRRDQFVVFSRFLGVEVIREELEEMGFQDHQMISKPRSAEQAEKEGTLHRLLEQLVTGVLRHPSST